MLGSLEHSGNFAFSNISNGWFDLHSVYHRLIPSDLGFHSRRRKKRKRRKPSRAETHRGDGSGFRFEL